jgi:hypothetical protein
LFESANYVGILHFQVDYTWFGRLVSTGTVFGVLLVLDFLFSKKLNSFLPARVWLFGALLIIVDDALFWLGYAVGHDGGVKRSGFSGRVVVAVDGERWKSGD